MYNIIYKSYLYNYNHYVNRKYYYYVNMSQAKMINQIMFTGNRMIVYITKTVSLNEENSLKGKVSSHFTYYVMLQATPGSVFSVLGLYPIVLWGPCSVGNQNEASLLHAKHSHKNN